MHPRRGVAGEPDRPGGVCRYSLENLVLSKNILTTGSAGVNGGGLKFFFDKAFTRLLDFIRNPDKYSL